MIDISYRLEFESPFIIGAPASDPGVFDKVSLLSDGLPYVPASSIRGRVKDAIRRHCVENKGTWDAYSLCTPQAIGEEDVAKGEGYCKPDNPCPFCRIFGIPGGEVTKGFEFTGAYMPEKEADLLKRFYEKSPNNAIFYRHSRNRRNYLLRRAQEDALFSAGLADPPTYLEGKIIETPAHVMYVEKTREFDYALLILGLRLVTEIGGERNRGRGRCRFIQSNWEAILRKHIEEWKRAKAKQKGNS
ncbi:MAG: RAMP superfamily CRISPR-associated protein [Nitrospirota bacterium]